MACEPELDASLAPDPPWRSATLLRRFPGTDTWGVLQDGKLEPLTLAEIESRLRNGTDTESQAVVFVTRPGSDRVLPAVECPELQRAIVARDRAALLKARRSNGLWFYPLLAFTLLLDLWLGAVAVLPAVYAMTTGSAHAEAWLALRKLAAHPSRYLADEAAKLRYEAWLGVAGAGSRCRTYWMLGAWLLVGATQLAVGEAPGADGLPRYLTGALVKDAVASEPWRLITAPLLHGSLLHFLMNASTLFGLGMTLERAAHRHLLVPVWIIGALGGGMLSWLMLPATSVGASGGILAVFAFLLVMGWRRRSQLPPDFSQSLMRSLLMIAMLGVLAWQVIDNAAHLGGALAGAALALIAFRSRTGPLPMNDSRALAVVGWVSELALWAATGFAVAKLTGVV